MHRMWLSTIPGVGAIMAATVKALVLGPDGFRSGRHFAAWPGLTPRPHLTGGKKRSDGISEMGNLKHRRPFHKWAPRRILRSAGFSAENGYLTLEAV